MKNLICLIPFIVFIGACKEDPTPPTPTPPCVENGLPCLTTEGKNMFACLVDGEPWIAETPPSISGPIPLSGEYNSSGGF